MPVYRLFIGEILVGLDPQSELVVYFARSLAQVELADRGECV